MNANGCARFFIKPCEFSLLRIFFQERPGPNRGSGSDSIHGLTARTNQKNISWLRYRWTRAFFVDYLGLLAYLKLGLRLVFKFQDNKLLFGNSSICNSCRGRVFQSKQHTKSAFTFAEMNLSISATKVRITDLQKPVKYLVFARNLLDDDVVCKGPPQSWRQIKPHTSFPGLMTSTTTQCHWCILKITPLLIIFLKVKPLSIVLDRSGKRDKYEKVGYHFHSWKHRW